MGYWTQIDGVLSSISVGNSSNIWGFNDRNEIFRRSFGTDHAWEGCTRLPNSKTVGSLSIGDCGHVLACSTDSIIFRWDPYNSDWHQFATGRLKKINIGNNYNIWGINESGTGFLYAMDDYFINSGNTEKLLDVSVGSDGSAIVLGETETIYRYLPVTRRAGDQGNYRPIGGISQVEEIATADESLMIALTKVPGIPRIQRYVGENSWTEFPFKDIDGNTISEKVLKVSLGADGTIIVLTDNTAGPSNIWQYVPYDVKPPIGPTKHLLQ